MPKIDKPELVKLMKKQGFKNSEIMARFSLTYSELREILDKE